jgi:outer membrane lipase/esterase
MFMLRILARRVAALGLAFREQERSMKSTHRAFRPVRTVLAAAVAFAALPAAAQTYSQTVFFGDSLTDSGWFRPALVQAGGPSAAVLGRFSTNPTQVWSEYLADYYGTNANSANQGGSNWAVGGGRTGTDSSGALGEIPSISTQINRYLTSTGGRADPNALYTVWGGANDLFAIAGGAPAQPTLATAIGAQIGNVATLTGAGAKYILVPTVPDLGLTPGFRAQGPVASATATQLTITYNNALFAGLAAQGLRVIPMDTYHLIQEIVASPGLYGFSNVTGTACQPQITAQSLTCNPGTYVTPDAAVTYAFADGVHPTGAAHRILGQYALSILEAPRQIAVLSYSESLVGKMRAEAVSSHVAGKPAEDGMHWWANVRGDNQRFETNNYDGGGPSLLFGVDWASGEFVYGAFAGWGTQDYDFGHRRGEFDQDDGTIGGFAGWYGEDRGANAQRSWTKTSYDVDRRVQLGTAERSYEGSPDGDNLSFGVNAGWNFHHGALTHGPVASVLVQKVSVDGYAENRLDSGALAYPDQDFDSTIASAGWQASYAIKDTVVPYARLAWEHEFEDAPEDAFAQSLSIPGTLPYAVPGLEHDENYGTAVLGLRTRFFGVDTDIGAVASVAQEGGDYASVFVTFGKKF